MTLETWLAFFVASWIISISPGAGAISCMSAGMRYGYRRGIWNIFGLQLGIMLQLAVVGAGLGAILATSTFAFSAVKWAGVAYLCYLGWRQLRAKPEPIAQTGNGSGSRRELFLQGFLVNATNPKGTVFLLAVLPQFIDPHAPQFMQYLLCGLTLMFTDLVVMSGYTTFASRVLKLLREPRQIRWINRLFGALFIGAGLLLAGFKRTA